MGYYRSTWKHPGNEAVEFFDDAFCDFADEPSPVHYEACEVPIEPQAGLVVSASLAFPTAHRCSA
jgi:hypothetical protein